LIKKDEGILGDEHSGYTAVQHLAGCSPGSEQSFSGRRKNTKVECLGFSSFTISSRDGKSSTQTITLYVFHSKDIHLVLAII
jgi:hypothetical protein